MVRLFTRRHPAFWWALALAIAMCSVLMFGAVFAGYHMAYDAQLVFSFVPVPFSLTIWYLSTEIERLSSLLANQLREDVRAPH
jgi:hypothetical protein